MTPDSRFPYRLDVDRYGLGDLLRWRPWLLVAAAALLTAALGAWTLDAFRTAGTLGAAAAALGALVWTRRRDGREIEGLPLAGELEATPHGLVIHHGRGKSRLRPWHRFDTLAFDPREGLLTLVPELGFAISLNRTEVENLDRLAEAIGRHVRVELESAREDEAIADVAPIAVG